MILAQVPEVTIVNEGAGGFSWTSLLTAAIPAIIAVAVVLIGGRQQRARQVDELAYARRRWNEERAFERERFALQERRTVYAEFLNLADQMIYLTTHAMVHQSPNHPHLCATDEEEAIQDWMQAHHELKRLMWDVGILGSLEFYENAKAIEDRYRTLNVTRARTTDIEEWLHGIRGDAPMTFQLNRLIGLAMVTARNDLVLPYWEDEDAEPLTEEEMDARQERFNRAMNAFFTERESLEEEPS